jgi:hypothetical protein
MGILVSLAMGFFLVSISKTQEFFSMISSIYMMTAMFMGGLIFPNQAA